jgi:hypothetical protein
MKGLACQISLLGVYITVFAFGRSIDVGADGGIIAIVVCCCCLGGGLGICVVVSVVIVVVVMPLGNLILGDFMDDCLWRGCSYLQRSDSLRAQC